MRCGARVFARAAARHVPVGRPAGLWAQFSLRPPHPFRGGPVAVGRGKRFTGRRWRRGAIAAKGAKLSAGGLGVFVFGRAGFLAAGLAGAGGFGRRRGERRGGNRPGGGFTPSIRQIGRRWCATGGTALIKATMSGSSSR